MGMLTDFFAASPRDAKRYERLVMSDDAKSEAKLEAMDRAEHKGFTGLELSALWAILAGAAFDVSRFNLKMGPMNEDSEGILEEFPADFTRRLSELADSNIQDVACAWCKTDGVRHSPDELEPILRDLRRLAVVATSTGYGVYMWYSV